MKLLFVVHHRFELWRVPAWFILRLREQFPQVEITHSESYEGVEQDLQKSEIIFTISLRAEQFALCQKLRWIHAPTAAVHQFLFPELVNSDVALTNSTEVHGPVVAEHVIALLFALAKKIPQAAVLQQKHIWGKEKIWKEGAPPVEIAGATLGLIGVGSIGRRVARMASTLGMRVIAVREHVEKGKPEGVEAVYSPDQMEEVLRQSDFIVLAAPLIAATEKLIDAERLAMMKSTAYLVNVGRGPQVNESALAEALRTRQIAGAALDVFEREPLPEDSPLWDLESLLITPHTAGVTNKLWYRHYDLFSANLRRYLAGESLQHVVDKRRGY
ncbi:MAG TPA: D-2-hydroxyacid dehydrogenase [Candidatus Sulfotelmatobacter sp.]|nr:D-2-hydroxyacid dehydrogenase [Candidatus Sulfotelmatobacter sp.]